MKTLGPSQARFPRGFFYLSGILTLLMSGFSLVQGILVSYAHNIFNIDLNTALHLNTLFVTLVFSLPLLSAYVVGRLLGLLLSTFIAFLFATSGLYFLCFQTLLYFYAGLALFCVGNAIAVANLFMILGRCLVKQPGNLSIGFMIAYTSMNGGAFITLILTPTILRLWGFQGTCLIGAILFILSMLLFLMISRSLYPACHEASTSSQHILKRILGIVIFMVFVPISMYCLEPTHNPIQLLIAACFICSLILCHQYLKRRAYKRRKQQLFAFMLLTSFSVSFWVLYALEPSLLTAFISTFVDRSIHGVNVPAHYFYALNPLFILCIGLILSIFMYYRQSAHTFATRAYQFSIGLALMGLGYIILAASTYFTSLNGFTNSAWILLSYGLLSAAELQISPYGLAMVARLPLQDTPALMGVWLFASGLGSALASAILRSQHSHMTQSISQYGNYFVYLGLAALSLAVCLALIAPRFIIRRHHATTHDQNRVQRLAH